MAIYIGTQKINVSGVDKVYVGSQLVYQASVGPIILDYITISGQTTNFNLNDTFLFDGTVTAHYSNGTTADVTNSSVIDSSQVNMSVEGIYTVYVSYTEGGITKINMYDIYVGSVAPDVTVITNIQNYAGANSWANGQKYLQVIMDSNLTADIVRTGSNSGSYYTSGYQWRLYQSDNGGVAFTTTSGIIKSIKITYSVTNYGQLEEITRQVVFPSGTAVDVSSWNANSITLMVTRYQGSTNAQVRITDMEITYGV